MTDLHIVEREGLLAQLLDSVKKCQVRFAGKTELATESDGHVAYMCQAWEAIFQHGMKQSNNRFMTFRQLTEVTGLTKFVTDTNSRVSESVFWSFVKCHLSAMEERRCMILKNINTDIGRGRAWLRAALNEHSLEKYLLSLIGSKDLLGQYYEPWAYLRDEEKCAALPNTAAGLTSILFAFSIDNVDFNRPYVSDILNSKQYTIKTSTVERNAAASAERKMIDVVDDAKERRRKKKPAKIVTFDDDSVSSLSASPASSIISPLASNNATNYTEHSSHRRTGSDLSEYIKKDGGTASRGLTSNKSSNEIENKNVMTDIGEIFSFDSFDKCKFDSPVHSHSESNTRTVQLDASRLRSNDADSVKSAYNLKGQKFLPEDCDIYSMSASSFVQKPTVGQKPSDNIGTSSDSSKAYLEHRDGVLNSSASGFNSSESRNLGMPIMNSRINGLKKSELKHSQSFPSSGSMLSQSLTSDDIALPDVDESHLSLVPLNSDGKPVDFSVSGNNDGDTTSGSCGSYDSRELVLPDVTQTSFATSSLNGNESFSTSGNKSLTYDELKEALVTMMLSKETIQQKNETLQRLLDEEKQRTELLTNELSEVQQQSKQQIERESERYKNLTKENELLKHQLRKYVSAVQMLRRQGASAEDFPGIHLEPLQPFIPPRVRSSADQDQESEDYEKKLIQVAEMHGELMEFNDLLQKQLLHRESQIRHLTDELVSLRGPLPVDIQALSDNVLGGTFDNDIGSIPVHPLINVWIPSAFLRGNSREVYHVYQVYIRIRDEEWNVYKRYAEFFEMHNKLRKKHPIVDKYNFPPKKTFGKKTLGPVNESCEQFLADIGRRMRAVTGDNREGSFLFQRLSVALQRFNAELKTVEERRKKLQNYLRSFVTLLMSKNCDLSESPNKDRLVQAIPFFSDVQAVKQERTERRSASRRNIELGNVSN